MRTLQEIAMEAVRVQDEIDTLNKQGTVLARQMKEAVEKMQQLSAEIIETAKLNMLKVEVPNASRVPGG